jgi:hypothetical protein
MSESRQLITQPALLSLASMTPLAEHGHGWSLRHQPTGRQLLMMKNSPSVPAALRDTGAVRQESQH